MRSKKKNKAPLAHSNLTEHEVLRSHYDPNGSWTGTPDGWDKDDAHAGEHDGKDIRDAEGGQDVYGEYMPTENGYVQSADGSSELEDGITESGVEAGKDMSAPGEYPLEGQVAPTDGDSYGENTRNMQGHEYPHHTDCNGMAETEAGKDMYTPCVSGENRALEHAFAHEHDDAYDDQDPMKLDAECGSDFYHEAKNTDVEVGKELYHYDIEAGQETEDDHASQTCCGVDPDKTNDGINDPGHDIESGSDIGSYAKNELLGGSYVDDIIDSQIESGKDSSDTADREAKHYGDIGNAANSDVEGGDDIYQNDIEFDPSKYESGVWKSHPEERPAPKNDVEVGGDIYPLGEVGAPAREDGYPSVPDGELTMEQAGVREDIIPVQDADDL